MDERVTGMSTWVCKNNLMKGSQMNTPATRRTSEPIDFNASQVCQRLLESTFATVRHRTRQTKGNGSRQATLAMVFQ
ncbi:MAG: hypothetical protein CMO80_17125, partial [Verrucomicrobiales bacterium]|nr:hypothetical protein [Verrucomicrobiales bacterium]